MSDYATRQWLLRVCDALDRAMEEAEQELPEELWREETLENLLGHTRTERVCDALVPLQRAIEEFRDEVEAIPYAGQDDGARKVG